uniref:Uncharacterized protein n=1 Tax=Oryza barthii TaxID=65489 RepID=A0A0D3F4N2_9ORYZ
MIHHYHLVQDSCFMQDTEGVEEEVRGVCKAVLFVYVHNKNEIKGSSSGATGKLAAHTHFIEHILSVLDFLNVLYCDQTNKQSIFSVIQMKQLLVVSVGIIMEELD